MIQTRTLSLLLLLISNLLLSPTSLADASPFDFAENNIETSPSSAKILQLGKGESVVDFDVSPIKPEAALIVKTATGKQKILFWHIGVNDLESDSKSFEIPGDINISAVAWHPLGQSLFLMVTRANHYEIVASPVKSWAPLSIYKTTATLRRLVVGPRPFEVGYDEKTNTVSTAYRLFFGVKKADGNFSTHTITEKGTREYKVLDSAPGDIQVPDADFQPNVLVANSALPAGFHPAGHFLIWEDEKYCFQKAGYKGDNWDNSTAITKGAPLCKGSLTYTPNGIGLLQWQHGEDGLTLRFDRGEKVVPLAKNIRFVSTPSSVADGKGLVGVTKNENGFAVHYTPVDVPLADVVNAWMFLETPRDRELFSANTGLFRPLENNQLYELYDSESYHCGGYDQSTPSRPYFVTTDIFWELYAAAFEGIFILSEKQAAIPNFWAFVQSAHESLKTQPDTKMAKAFAALVDVYQGGKSNPEAKNILNSSGIAISSVTREQFNYGNLKPRSHYTTDPELKRYFQASKYLMDLPLDDIDTKLLKSLPISVLQNAQAWINIYTPFIAPSKRPLLWGTTQHVPAYVLHPEKREQLFPLSWGLDNEILFSSVYHENVPENEQIKGPAGLRLLPLGLDVAAVLGSQMAETILAESGEFQKYPPLKNQIAALKKRTAESITQTGESLYHRWLIGLSAQWSDSVSSPGDTIGKNLWQRKRLQTGLASWATLRHATLLVNERTQAECGEAGFEQIVLRPPRGYVEPDPTTFDAIANLFDATINMVKVNGKNWSGVTPDEAGGAAAGLQNGVIRRLTESRNRVLAFRDMAKKELEGKPLTTKEYEDILYVARAAEHNFLIFKSLAQKDFALSTPDPIPKIADVAAAQGRFLLAGVGSPLEWDQIVPFFGRKQIVKGSTYSYYEKMSNQVMDDDEWRAQLKNTPQPKWIENFISKTPLSCPAKAP